jgi:hypothetical protein
MLCLGHVTEDGGYATQAAMSRKSEKMRAALTGSLDQGLVQLKMPLAEMRKEMLGKAPRKDAIRDIVGVSTVAKYELYRSKSKNH